jgi:hypothetical protein
VRSPLRHIPGPWYAKLSRAWILAVEATGERHFYLDTLHQRYGPVVRIGPKEVSFASADATRDIYVGVSVVVAAATAGAGTGHDPTTKKVVTKTFPKAPIYDITRSTVGFMTDEAAHRERLRHVAPVFAPAVLQPAMEPVIRAKLATLLSALEKRRAAPVDMLHWFRMFALDTVGGTEYFVFPTSHFCTDLQLESNLQTHALQRVLGQLFAGKSFDALTSPSSPKFAHYMDTAIHAWYLKAYMPRTFAFFQRLPFKNKSLSDFLESGDGVYEVRPGYLT